MSGSPRQAHFDFSQDDAGHSTGGTVTPDEDRQPGTPGVAATAAELRKSLSFSSLRALEMQDIRRKVWRGPNQLGNRRPKDLEQLTVFVLRGALRSFTLGYSIRAGVALVVAFFRLISRRQPKLAPAFVRHALLGEDAFRFGGMLGSFTLVWRAVYYGMRILNRARRSEIWHAPLAGALSAVSLLVEKPSRRLTLAQQFSIRGLQGLYNYGRMKGWLYVPYGSIILFGLSNGFIMSSWLLFPHRMAPGYHRWVTGASRVASPALPINADLYHRHKFAIDDAYQALNWPGITATNRTQIESMIQKASHGNFDNLLVAPCCVIHPWVDSCFATAVDRWQSVFRWISPVYAALHFIPPIFLRRKQFARDPGQMLKRSVIGTLRSASFLATFVAIFQSLICMQRNMLPSPKTPTRHPPQLLQCILTHRYFYVFAGWSTCLSLFIEERKRRGELALYCLPKALEILHAILRERGLFPRIPAGEVLLSSFGLASLMAMHKLEPARLSGLVRSLLNQFD